mgnify:CR=1 FL=1
MSDFIIGHVTDSKEGPMDGVYAETKGTYTKFKGTGVFQKEKRILHQKVTDVGIKASLQTGMVSINDRNRNQAIAVSITEMVAVLNEALRYGTAGKGIDFSFSDGWAVFGPQSRRKGFLKNGKQPVFPVLR